MTRPIVTVLVDTYNHERFIEQAIASVLEQDFPMADAEILVVDDGSTDRTQDLVRRFEPRVRLLQKKNGGQASAFNHGIAEARGEIVAFLDGDDWWAPNKLKAVIEVFRDNPTVGVVGHGIVQLENATGCGSTFSPETTGYFDLRSTQGAQTFRNYMCFLGTSRVAIRRSVLAKVLPIPDGLVVEADEFMSAVAVGQSGGFLLAEPLAFYRLHEQNLYQFRTKDPARSRRKADSLRCLVEELPLALKAAGVSSEAIAAVVEPIEVSATRMKLALDGGTPWQTYRVEQADYRLAYRNTSWGYRVFKEFSLLFSLLLPPRLYYRLRDWYAEHNIRRFRSWLGEPRSTATVREEMVGRVSATRGQD